MSGKQSYTIIDFYRSYINSIDAGTIYDIDYKLYRTIIIEYFKHMRNQIIEEGKTWKLAYRLGKLSIMKKRPANYHATNIDNRSGLLIDFHATKEYNKTIFHMNEHTNGFKYRYCWDKSESLIINKKKYQLVMTRANKRRLAEILKNNLRDYPETR